MAKDTETSLAVWQAVDFLSKRETWESGRQAVVQKAGELSSDGMTAFLRRLVAATPDVADEATRRQFLLLQADLMAAFPASVAPFVTRMVDAGFKDAGRGINVDGAAILISAASKHVLVGQRPSFVLRVVIEPTWPLMEPRNATPIVIGGATVLAEVLSTLTDDVLAPTAGRLVDQTVNVLDTCTESPARAQLFAGLASLGKASRGRLPSRVIRVLKACVDSLQRFMGQEIAASSVDAMALERQAVAHAVATWAHAAFARLMSLEADGKTAPPSTSSEAAQPLWHEAVDRLRTMGKYDPSDRVRKAAALSVAAVEPLLHLLGDTVKPVRQPRPKTAAPSVVSRRLPPSSATPVGGWDLSKQLYPRDRPATATKPTPTPTPSTGVDLPETTEIWEALDTAPTPPPLQLVEAPPPTKSRPKPQPTRRHRPNTAPRARVKPRQLSPLPSPPAVGQAPPAPAPSPPPTADVATSMTPRLTNVQRPAAILPELPPRRAPPPALANRQLPAAVEAAWDTSRFLLDAVEKTHAGCLVGIQAGLTSVLRGALQECKPSLLPSLQPSTFPALLVELVVDLLVPTVAALQSQIDATPSEALPVASPRQDVPGSLGGLEAAVSDLEVVLPWLSRMPEVPQGAVPANIATATTTFLINVVAAFSAAVAWSGGGKSQERTQAVAHSASLLLRQFDPEAAAV